MSVYRCIASNVVLPDIVNEKIEYFSVNQAKQRGIVLPDYILDNQSIDPDKDSVILSCACEEDLNEISITLEQSRSFGKSYSDKKYLSQLTGRFTSERIERIYNYVMENLSLTDEMDIWQLWEGEVVEPTVIVAKDQGDLKGLLNQYLSIHTAVTPVCIRATRTIKEST